MFSKDLLRSEKTLSSWINASLLATTISGYLALFISVHSTYTQLNSIFHLLVGLVFTAISLPYFYVHFKRTLVFRRAGLLFSGICLLLLLLGVVYSGFHLAIKGITEAKRYMLSVHLYFCTSFIITLVLHIFLHVAFFPSHRKKSQQSMFPSYSPNNAKVVWVLNLSVQGIVLVSTLAISALMQETPVAEAAVKPYTYDYGDHKFRPAQTETYDNNFVRYEDIAASEKCLSCHTDLAEQWMSSMHRLAAADPTYVTNIELLTQNKGMSAARYCEGCHAPVALLTGQLTEGGNHGGTMNTLAHAEGISCMSCHGIQSLSHEKGNGSYVFKPSTDYLFAESDNALLSWLNERLIKIDPAKHREEMANPLMQEPKMCASCHSQFMDVEMNDWAWIKMQDDFTAWLNSPFAQHHDTEFSAQEYTRCQDCHMPLVESKDPSANEQGLARSHRFVGANTFIPVMRNDEKQFDLTKRFLQSNKVRLAIDEPNREDAYHSEFHLDESLRNTADAPFFYYLGETADIEIVVSNIGVGHNFPAGTIDINQVWLEAIVVDAKGKVVFSSGAIDDNGVVDSEAYFYGSTPVDRNGNHVWKHDLFNMVGTSFKRVIPAGESDIVNYRFDIPVWVEPPLTLSTRLRYRKLNNRYARWALKDQYFELPIVDMAWDSLQIPIELVPKVQDRNSAMRSSDLTSTTQGR